MMISAIIQARMGSTRLPKKVLKNIENKPMLWHIIQRVKKAELVDKIIIATTIKEEELPIAGVAEKTRVDFFRGSENDVLDRYYRAAKKYKAKVIVRITADCPLIDPRIVDKVVKYFLENDFDYVGNTLKRTYPDGLDTEVFSYRALEKAWREAKKSSEREHVTSYIWNHPQMFKLSNVENNKDFSYMRWTVDEERDLKFVREIYKRLYKKGKIFYMRDVLKLLKRYPELMDINKNIVTNEGYLKSLKEDKILNIDQNGETGG